MEQDNDLVNLLLSGQALSTANRALRLRLAFPDGISDNILLPQRVNGVDAICDGFEYRILCVSGEVNFPLKNFISLAAELQIVTDQGELHSICGFVTGASSGESDGGLATYQLVVRDALAVLSMKTNKRVFREKNEIDIIEVLLGEWRQRNPQLASSFEFEFAPELKQHNFPKREFTMQYKTYLCAVADWRLKKLRPEEELRPGILEWNEFNATFGIYWKDEPVWRMSLIEGNADYYSNGTLPECLPLLPKGLPKAVVSETVNSKRIVTKGGK